MRTLGFALAPAPCDIADAAEGICDLPTSSTPSPTPSPTGQRPPAPRPESWSQAAKAWALAHSTELLIGAAAIAVLAVALGGRRR